MVDETLGLFAVADGVTVSSYGSGAVAAELCLRILREKFRADLPDAVKSVNEAMVSLRTSDRSIGETTLTAAATDGRLLSVCSVGDSPAFLVRKDALKRLVQEDRDPRGRITQVVGMPRAVDIHSESQELHAGDFVILASDGVGHVLQPRLLEPPNLSSPSHLADAIIREAKANPTGYDDDKSVIVLYVQNH